MRLPLLALLVTCASSISSAQAPLESWFGTQDEQLGTVTRAVGDFDGDGRPDVAASSAHAVRVYSSATLALLRAFPSPVAESHAIEDFDFADFNGDGTLDLLIGAPRSSVLFAHNGSAWVFSGSNGQPLVALQGTQVLERLGHSVLAIDDISGDGRADFAVSSPGWGGGRGRVQFVSGAGGAILSVRTGPQSFSRLGHTLELVGDANGDLLPELGISSATSNLIPLHLTDRIEVISLPGLALLGASTGTPFSSFHIAGDVNGDGLHDVVALPDNPAWVGGPLFTIRFGGGATADANGPSILLPEGTKPVLTPAIDVDGDGIAGEFLIGAGAPFVPESGRVYVCRGTGILQTIYDAQGSLYNGFGSALSALGDFDGNQTDDFLVGAPFHGVDPLTQLRGGKIVVLSAITPEPVGYCTAKTNGLGCVPQLASVGVVSLSGADVLTVAATNVLNRRAGLCLWGTRRQELPFSGGYLCVAPPFQRGPVTNSGGNSSGDDCSGRLEFNLLPLAMWLYGVEIGDLVRLQFWYRDPLHVDGTGAGLSAALEARVGW